MKNMKKITALLLATIMVFAMAISTFAASITVKDPNGKAPSGYEIYQVFKGDIDMVDGAKTLVNIEWGNGVITTDGKIAVGDASYDAAEAAKALADGTITADAFAAIVAGKLNEANKITTTANVKSENLAPGYYFVKNSGTAAAGQAYTKYILQVLGDVDINVKTDAPTIEKKIKNEGEPDKAYRDANNVAIGDKVNYQITSKVPDMTHYTKYFYVVNDQLSKGLDYKGNLVVKVGDKTLSADDYDVTVSDYDATTGTHIEIVFKNFIQYKNMAGAPIVITYDAELNDNAIIGTNGNPNNVDLTYSNNPNKTGEGDDENPDKPGKKDDDVVGTTPKDWTITYTTDLGIFKFDEVTKEALVGAVFTLEGTKTNNATTYTEQFTEDAEGTWYKLTDGTYTQETPNELTSDKYASDTTYKKELVADDKTTTEQVTITVTTDENGHAKFTGSLAEGTYTITEIQAPNGYNKLENPIEIVITSNSNDLTINAGDETCTWEVKQDGVIIGTNDDHPDIDVTHLVNIGNNKGTVLPSTGGMGTTIFYTLGAALVLFAGVLLVSKRRMA